MKVPTIMIPRFPLRQLAAGVALLAATLVATGAVALDEDREDYAGAWSDRGDDRRNTARPQRSGDFDYYALVLSWSPTHCADSEGDDDELQCNRTDGRRYAFVLHGLWPQYERGFPENCYMPGRGYVPQPVIDRMLDIMPSKALVIHEYRKHGMCSGLRPDAYYESARQLFKSITIPKRFVNPFENQFVSPDELVDEFTEVNPGLAPEMMAVSCAGSGNRLRELRICFSKDGKPTACGSNENQRRLCTARTMFVPPVRSARSEPETAEEREKLLSKSPLPMPRLIPGPH